MYDLSYTAVLIATSLILVNGIVSFALQLNWGYKLLLASLRTVVQLSLVGFVLRAVFEQHRWWTLLPLMLLMTVIAGVASVKRVRRRHPGIWLNSLTSVLISSWLITGIALFAIIGHDAWKEQPARYAIPLLGMILGNTLTGISLGMNKLTDELMQKRKEIELRLTLGATRWEAAHEAIQEAIRTGMIPIINGMMIVGLVSLPGLMTGQLLAGADPVTAVKYQIVIMFLIAAGTGLGTVGAILLGYLRLFNARHQFLYEHIFDTESKS